MFSTFFLSATVIASGTLERSLWYPTILGVLVVVAAALLFVGSIYLLLGTNMGARLAFLVTFSALTGFMVLLSGLWITTASPLNTLRGSVPEWEIKEVVPSLDKATSDVARNAERDGVKLDAIGAANVKAAVDEGLVTKVDDAIETFTPEDNEFAIYTEVTDFLVVNTWVIGGSEPSWLDGEFRHTPKYAVVQFCGDNPDTVFGLPVPTPECAPDGTEAAENDGFVILELNLGDVRFPPIIAFFSSIILFVLSLILFGWYEKDRRAEVAAAESAPATTPARTREPANA